MGCDSQESCRLAVNRRELQTLKQEKSSRWRGETTSLRGGWADSSSREVLSEEERTSLGGGCETLAESVTV